MTIFYQPSVTEGIQELDAEESRHCVKVLRKRPGDLIAITDGKGTHYTARLVETSATRCTYAVEQHETCVNDAAGIHIAVAPTKNPDRIEWFVEKAVELGIGTITLMTCTNSERTSLKTERLHKLAISAMKQSQRLHLPAIQSLMPFDQVVAQATETQKFIAYVDAANPDLLIRLAQPAQPTLVLIGPEGDFISDELALAFKHGFRQVSLGLHRLRTETAALAACHILNLVQSRP